RTSMEPRLNCCDASTWPHDVAIPRIGANQRALIGVVKDVSASRVSMDFAYPHSERQPLTFFERAPLPTASPKLSRLGVTPIRSLGIRTVLQRRPARVR